MITNKRNETVAKMLELMNSNKLNGNFIIQTEWNKTIELKDFNITCASVCDLYYKLSPVWRDHIIGIEHSGESKKDAWVWVLDDAGTRKITKEKMKHQI